MAVAYPGSSVAAGLPGPGPCNPVGCHSRMVAAAATYKGRLSGPPVRDTDTERRDVAAMTVLVKEMLETYPADLGGVDRQALERCIEECIACAQACDACADACLSEEHIGELVKCVRTNMDCADICTTTGRVLSRHTGYDANVTRAQLLACVTACKACADECDKHARMHEHCRLCAEACRRCEEACRALIDHLG